jgi:type IV secretory pathway component VirB8
MNNKTEKKRRRFFRVEFSEKINDDANKLLKIEMFRIARNRDILGVLLIIASAVIIALIILLIKHW